MGSSLYLPKYLPGQCRDVDQPTAGLIKDLKQRGLLEDTLVVMVGEFGRTCYGQVSTIKITTVEIIIHDASQLSSLAVAYKVSNMAKQMNLRTILWINPFMRPACHPALAARLRSQSVELPFQGLNIKLTGVNPAHVVQGILSNFSFFFENGSFSSTKLNYIHI